MPEPFDALGGRSRPLPGARTSPGTRASARRAASTRRASLARRGRARGADRRLQARARLRVRRGGRVGHLPHERHDASARAARTRCATSSTYDAAALAFGRAMLARGLACRVPVLVLGPSAAEAPDSSLAHMCSALRARARRPAESPSDVLRPRRGARRRRPARARRARSSCRVSCARPGDELRSRAPARRPRRRSACRSRRAAASCRRAASRASRARSRADELRRDVRSPFAVDERAVVGEYGMTELSSQFWEATAVDPGARPASTSSRPGRASCRSIRRRSSRSRRARSASRASRTSRTSTAPSRSLAQDRVRRVAGGFELLGRAAGRAAARVLDRARRDALVRREPAVSRTVERASPTCGACSRPRATCTQAERASRPRSPRRRG